MYMTSNQRFQRKTSNWLRRNWWGNQTRLISLLRIGWLRRVLMSRLKGSSRRLPRIDRRWLSSPTDHSFERARKELQLQKVSLWFPRWMIMDSNCLNGICCTWNLAKTFKRETKMKMKLNSIEKRRNTLSNLIRTILLKVQAISIGLNPHQ